MRVLFVASEAHPLMKTGGLADVAGALPAALAEAGADVRLMLPGYPSAFERAEALGPAVDLHAPLDVGETRLVPARMPGSGLPVLLVDCPVLFRREGNPYVSADGRDWQDNHLRFAMLAKAAAVVGEVPDLLGWRPDVIHANDWQTGLIPAYLPSDRRLRPATVFTIHNIQFQGCFPPNVLHAVGLTPEMYSVHGVEFYGHLSFLKAGLFYSDKITTVSPTYAREITGKIGGWGMDGLLRARGSDLRGILNGADYEQWNPAADPFIRHPYGPDTTAEGKALNKTALQREMHLDDNPEAPLVGIVSRLTDQKGLDLVPQLIPEILLNGAQIALVGAGDPAIEHEFERAAAKFPGRVAVHVGYDEGLAHRIQAGADLFLMPSRREPCGLTQLYALRYGTLPVVRRTGGLADTVRDLDHDVDGTGFAFSEPAGADLMGALSRAFSAYRDPGIWNAARTRAMAEDFCWGKAAKAYLDLYRVSVG